MKTFFLSKSKSILLPLFPVILTLSIPNSFAADCADLTGRYSLDQTPTPNSTFLVITQSACAQIDMVWFVGPRKSTEYLRDVDGQPHSFGNSGGFAVTETWTWKPAADASGKTSYSLQAVQEYNSVSQGEDSVESAIYSLDSNNDLSESVGETDNGVADDAGFGTYYRVK